MRLIANGVFVAALAFSVSWAALASAQTTRDSDGASELFAEDATATLEDAGVLRRKAASAMERGRYLDATTALARAVQIYKHVFNYAHPEIGRALNELAASLNSSHDAGNALMIGEAAQRILEPALGSNDLDFAESQCRIADALTMKAEYARAGPLHALCLSILERLLPIHDVRIAAALFGQGVFYAETGDNGYAEVLFDRALRLFEARFGPDHPRVAMVRTRLAWIYFENNDRERARELFKRALIAYQKAFGGNNVDVAYAATGLGLYLSRTQDNARAQVFLEKAKVTYEESVGKDHPDLVPVLIHLGLLAQEKNDYTGDRPLFERALAIQQKAFGPEGAHVAEIFGFLGKHYKENKDVVRAEAMYLRALEAPHQKSYAGPEVYDTRAGPYGNGDIFSLNGLITIYEEQGKTERALDYRERAIALQERLMSRVFAFSAEEQKRMFFDTSVWQTDAMLSLDVRTVPANERTTRLAFTTLLQRKGRIVDSSADMVAAVRNQGNAEDRPFLGRLQAARSALASLTLRGRLSNETAVEHEAKLATLREDARLREQDLARRYSTLLAEQQPITLGAVQARLGERQALLEIALFTRIDPSVPFTRENFERRFVAYVLKHSGPPQRVELGLQWPIDDTVQRLRDGLSTGGPYAEAARSLDQQVMEKIRPLLGGISDVFLSPDGSLSTVPFAALLDVEGHFLVETTRFTYLSSGRDLMRLDSEIPAQSAPVMFAAPDYDFRVPLTPAERVANSSSNGRRSVDFGKLHFRRLPGTADEAVALSRLLSDATVLTGARATKLALFSVRGPRILHIATHGFFMQEASAGDEPPRPAPTSAGRPAVELSADPLLRSGLAFAGANHREEGSSGVVTALEASSLDLRGTKLVVLSACETGLLEVKYGDGAYGLRRALTLAGAESQMLTLWQVDDRVTPEVMTSYYQKLLHGGARSQSLRDAQLELLSRPATTHPYYWASFIVAGDQRTLDGRAAPDVRPSFVSPGARSVERGVRGCACNAVGTAAPLTPTGGLLLVLALGLRRLRRFGRAGIVRSAATR